MATYNISTLDDLQDMGSHLTDECVLLNDIDASETASWNYGDGVYQGFIPIGSSGSQFKGSFNGGGFTIRGLTINRDYSTPHLGLFGFIENEDQKITNGTFTGSATGWTLGTGWTYNSNAVDKDSDGTGTLSQASAAMDTTIESGHTYTLKFTISGWSVGTVTPSCGGVILSARSGDGTFEEEFTADTDDAALVFTPTDTSRFTIDTITLYRKHTFTNVKVLDASIVGRTNWGSGGPDCGIFAGESLGEANSHINFSDIDVSGDIYTYYASTGSSSSGGFCEIIGYSDIDNCTADVNQYCGSSANGFIGGSYGACVISNCRATGSIIRTGTRLSGYGNLAGFVGAAGTTSGRCTYDNCSASVGIIDLDQYAGSQPSNIGGFVGSIRVATMTECIAYCNIVKVYSGHANIGGFYGRYSTSSSPTPNFYRCAAVGSIEWTAPNTSSIDGIGGFAGQLAYGTVNDCYAIVDICQTGFTAPSGMSVGGFVGILIQSIVRCYSASSVPSLTASKMGGFIGYKAGGTPSDCFFDTEVAGTSDGVGTGTETGVTGETTDNMKLQDTYTNYDFDTVWEITTFEQGALSPTNLTVWLSKVDDYDSFEEGTNDDDSVTVIVPSTNEIRWIASLESLLVGTSGDEWRIGSNKLETSITPTNYKVEQQTEYGSKRIQPIKINSSIIFVDYVGRKLRELTFTGEKYEAPDLTSLAEHITESGIVTISRQKNPDSIIWVTLDNGKLCSMTYERDQNVVAWAEHPMGDGVEVQSVDVTPNANEDDVNITVQRTINSSDVIYWERMASRTFDAIEDCFFVDSGITFETATYKSITAFADYSGTVTGTTKVTLSAAHTLTTGQDVIITGTTNYDGQYTVTVLDSTSLYITVDYVADDATGSLYIPVTSITGLSHLEGETVQVLGDGVVLDEEVVSSGAITASTAVLQAQVGLSYTWKLSPMRIVFGDDTGTSLGSNVRISQMVVSFLNTLGAEYYTTDADNAETIDFDDRRWTNEGLITDLFTGDVLVSLPGGFNSQTPLVITGDDPLPATVRCIIARAEKTGM